MEIRLRHRMLAAVLPLLAVLVTITGIASARAQSDQVPLRLQSSGSEEIAITMPLDAETDAGKFSFGTPAYAYASTADVFTPENLVELTRPGTGVANGAGDLLIVPTTKYSIKNKK